MKLKVVIVDLELSRRQKILGAIALGSAVALASTVATAELVTFTSGQVLTAADLNANFAELHGRLTDVENAPGNSAFLAYNTTAFVTNSTGPTIIFDDEEFDAGNEYDPLTGEFTTADGGLYDINCNLIFRSDQTTTNYYIEAGIFVGTLRTDVSAAYDDGYAQTFGVHSLLRLDAGEVVSCHGYSSAGSLPLQQVLAGEIVSSFSAVRLAPL